MKIIPGKILSNLAVSSSPDRSQILISPAPIKKLAGSGVGDGSGVDVSVGVGVPVGVWVKVVVGVGVSVEVQVEVGVGVGVRVSVGVGVKVDVEVEEAVGEGVNVSIGVDVAHKADMLKENNRQGVLNPSITATKKAIMPFLITGGERSDTMIIWKRFYIILLSLINSRPHNIMSLDDMILDVNNSSYWNAG